MSGGSSKLEAKLGWRTRSRTLIHYGSASPCLPLPQENSSSRNRIARMPCENTPLSLNPGQSPPGRPALRCQPHPEFWPKQVGRPCLFLLSRASSVIATPGPGQAEFLQYFNNQPPFQWLVELQLTCRQLPVGPSRRLHIVRAQDDEPFATAHQSTLSMYHLPILPSPALSRPRRLEPSAEDHQHN